MRLVSAGLHRRLLGIILRDEKHVQLFFDTHALFADLFLRQFSPC